MVRMMQIRAAKKARRRIDGNFHVGSIGGDVRAVPGTGTVEGEKKLAKLASDAYELVHESAAQRRRTSSR